MEIKEFRQKRSEMEGKLQSSISSIVEEFRRDTGLTPYSISVDMIDVTSIGSFEKKYTVGQVLTKIDL